MIVLFVIHTVSGGFNGRPVAQWPTRPLPQEASEAPMPLSDLFKKNRTCTT